jgi:hypothetical protein
LWDDLMPNAECGVGNENQRLKRRVWPQTHADGHRLHCPVDMTGQKAHSLSRKRKSIVYLPEGHDNHCGDRSAPQQSAWVCGKKKYLERLF